MASGAGTGHQATGPLANRRGTCPGIASCREVDLVASECVVTRSGVTGWFRLGIHPHDGGEESLLGLEPGDADYARPGMGPDDGAHQGHQLVVAGHGGRHQVDERVQVGGVAVHDPELGDPTR